MSFSDVQKEILETAKESKKRTFSEATFNKLTSALANEPGYETKIVKNRGGELVEETIKPVADLRKSVIGGIAKSVGADDAAVEKAVAEYQFPATTPWYGFISESITEYGRADKAFHFLSKSDFDSTITMDEIPEQIKMNGAPGAPASEKKPVVYGKHVKMSCSSSCPKHLRKDQ